MEQYATKPAIAEAEQDDKKEELSPVELAYPHVQWATTPDGTLVPMTRANRRRYLKAIGRLGSTRKRRVKAYRGDLEA